MTGAAELFALPSFPSITIVTIYQTEIKIAGPTDTNAREDIKPREVCVLFRDNIGTGALEVSSFMC